MLFLGIAGFLLFTEHRAHLLGALPYLILFACPLMHLFHHGGHRHGQGNVEHSSCDHQRKKVASTGESQAALETKGPLS